MFTGIVKAIGTVTGVENQPSGVRITIEHQSSDLHNPTLAHGDSICVSGVCLTVTDFDEFTMSFDVIRETLAKTTLGEIKPGCPVNLEPLHRSR